MGKFFSPQILSVSARPRCCRASLFALWQALKQPPCDKMIVTMTVTSTAAPSHGFSNPHRFSKQKSPPSCLPTGTPPGCLCSTKVDAMSVMHRLGPEALGS